MELMKRYKITWSSSFIQELKNICSYLAYDLGNYSSAQKFRNEIYDKIYSLEFYPERFTKLLFSKNVRKFYVGNCIVLYEVYRDYAKVDILHIFHSKQNYFNLI